MTSCFATAQKKLKISGEVLDSSGNPIAYAHLKVSNSNTGTISNSSGEFSIVIPFKCDDYYITVSHIGYTTSTIKIDCSRTKFKVILSEEIETLSEVTISALTAEAVVKKVISNMIANYHLDSINYVMFTRITEKKEKPTLLQEYVYNLFSINGKTNEFNIIKSRSIAFDKNGKKRERKMYVTGLQSNESHLMLKYIDNFLKRKKIKRYNYSFLEDILYEGELYYRIKVESVKNNYTLGGEIWVHPSNYGIAYLKDISSDEKLGEFYFNRESESYYKLVNDKWFFSHGFYRYSRTNPDSDTPIHYAQLTVVTDYQFTRQFDKKEKLEYYTERTRKYYEPFSDDFWEEYNHIPIDSMFKNSLTGAKNP